MAIAVPVPGATISSSAFGAPVAGVVGNSAGISVAASAGDTTTSSSYANMAAVSSFSFTKHQTSSSIRIDLTATSFIPATAPTTARFGVLINGVDYDVTQLCISTTTDRGTAAGFAIVAAGLAAGTYTIQARWKRASGTGTCSRVITDDWLSLMATEVAP